MPLLIAGVVVYMFVSGSLSSMTTGTGNVNDRLSVQGASVTTSVAAPDTGTALSTIISNTGSKASTITGMILKDANGNTVQSVTTVTTVPVGTPANSVPASSTATVNGGLSPSVTLVKGAQYTITVITAGGGSFLSGPFVPYP